MLELFRYRAIYFVLDLFPVIYIYILFAYSSDCAIVNRSSVLYAIHGIKFSHMHQLNRSFQVQLTYRLDQLVLYLV